MPSRPRILRRSVRPAVLLVPLLALAAAQGSAPELAPLAGTTDTAELRFDVRARGGGPIPARLTFVPPEGGAPVLFTATGAAPHELAARDNIVYTRTGQGRITVPPGSYTVHVSRGPEWSLDSRPFELRAGTVTELHAELVHELATPGWISGDFHLHTLTWSGHGDASMEERVLSFLGEGLEFAVATDHDHVTDYRPTLAELGISSGLAVASGDEVTTPIGHFNAFPLDPARPPVDSQQTDANVLFRLLRAERGPGGTVPVIQLNHPRLQGIDYFTRTGLDPITGTSANPAYSRDFDAIEVLNENLALGYHDPVADGTEAHGHLHSALVDWFRQLNQGERYAAVGNSDSHHVRAVLAGYPRNYVRVPDDDPARVDGAAVAEAVRAKTLFTTTGPFLEYAVNGVRMGGEVRATGGHATLSVRVRAASWVGVDRVKVFQDGDLVATLPVPATKDVLRLEQEVELCFLGRCERHGHRRSLFPGPHDAWITLVAEGDSSLAPVLREDARPLAIGNPVWVDADGDGHWVSPRERVAAEIKAQPTPVACLGWFRELAPEEQMLALALAPRGPFAATLVEEGFHSPLRNLRLAAARASESLVLSGAQPEVMALWRQNLDDPFLDALLVRLIAIGRPSDGPASLEGYLRRYGADVVRDYADELLPLFPGGVVSAWKVLGPLPEGETPATPPGADARLPGRDGAPREWSDFTRVSAAGYADLVGLGGEDTEHCRVYARAYLRSDRARTVLCAFGSDDSSRVWLGDRLVYEDARPKSANPLETLLALDLQPGWNRLELEIGNVGGGFGFYCRVLDPAVVSAGEPDGSAR